MPHSRPTDSLIVTLMLRYNPILSLQVRLAFCPEPGTMSGYMESVAENCPHSGGLQVVVGSGFWCPTCEARLDMEGVVCCGGMGVRGCDWGGVFGWGGGGGGGGGGRGAPRRGLLCS